ncbi:MAG: undecaprenyl-diphosphate phosphatase [Treponema sp.]|nr:undecaprenyl-diphosphate phosphatase [Treponema sp.]
MTVLQGIILGFVQGVAEFLPISSSGHLDVMQHLFGLSNVPILFDIFLHLATLFAVCLFFWKKIWKLLKAFGRLIARRPMPEAEIDNTDLLCGNTKAAQNTILAIIITTIITGAIGVVTSKLIPEMGVKVTCTGFIVTALLLIVSAIIEVNNQKHAKFVTEMEGLSANKADSEPKGVSIVQSIVIGFMQGFGTLPGISRSGSTISGALFSGVNRAAAGEFSFIVSIPAILGAFILELKDIGDVKETVGFWPIFAGCLTAFVVGYFSLYLLMKLIKKGKLSWFAAYLIPVGILGLIFLK